ncbi:DUF4956 domain-containing protein [Pontibacter sp. BAB1700]|uniref:DUF4956 domain-containing protein n=1 Tax=Pontibacter sp. BAB1700 TaxID=1144253 RepID=UPI00178C643F|nr:DUF4956 domain-containing protein [Pontibacter sp. BAB1700]
MITDFQYLELFPLTIFDLLSNLMVAIICGLIISWVYRITYDGPAYPTTFVNSLVILPIITSVVILLIGNNIARAFGLVGAMSIIRFRTAVRDTQDIIFIFFALAVGMAAGANLGVTAIVATFVIGMVIAILIKSSGSKSAQSPRYYHLALSYATNQENESIISTMLSTYCDKTNLVSYEKQKDENLLTAADYIVLIKKDSRIDDLILQLNQILVEGSANSKAIVTSEEDAIKSIMSKKSKKEGKKKQAA